MDISDAVEMIINILFYLNHNMTSDFKYFGYNNKTYINPIQLSIKSKLHYVQG